MLLSFALMKGQMGKVFGNGEVLSCLNAFPIPWKTVILEDVSSCSGLILIGK